jgi:hypothetical protein
VIRFDSSRCEERAVAQVDELKLRVSSLGRDVEHPPRDVLAVVVGGRGFRD